MPEHTTTTETTRRKTGRPTAEYRAADGTKYQGLSRRANGRWRISATGEEFREPDETAALKRFDGAMARLRGEDIVHLPVEVPPGPMREKYLAARKAAQIGGGRFHMHIKAGETPRFYIPVGGPEYWAAVRRDLLADPKLVALKTGVEWVARGADLPRPSPSVALMTLGDTYASKKGLSSNEASRAKLYWREFCRVVEVATVRELGVDRIRTYQAKMEAKSLAAKSLGHRFAMVRRILSYAIRKQIDVECCRRVLDFCQLLEAHGKARLDPQPIRPGEFWAVYEKVVEARDPTFAAMMLAALNLAMYGREAGALTWDEVDLAAGTVVTRRQKTDVPRIGVLWPQTRAAIEALPRNRDTIFNTRSRSYTQFSTVDAWGKYRTLAGLGPSAKFSQIRDAAYSVALGVSWEQAELLAGHRLPGSSDNYLLRNPQLVAQACAAIGIAFDVDGHVSTKS